MIIQGLHKFLENTPPTDSLKVIKSGSVKVFIESERQTEVIIATTNSGKYLTRY